MSNSQEKLFSDFVAPSRQEWLDKIQVDLKGADFEKKLVWQTSEGFNVQPFYRREDIADSPLINALPGQYPFLRGNNTSDNNWKVRQNIPHISAEADNKFALGLLDKGVNSFGFTIDGNEVSAQYVETLLEGIDVEQIELNFSTCQRHALELAQILTALFEKRGADKSKVCGSIEFDPYAKLLTAGHDTSKIAESFAAPIVNALAQYPQFNAITVAPCVLSQSGAYIYQELGYALAWGADYMQMLTDNGVAPLTAAQSIKFSFGVGTNYFMEIAKFRAARMLWASILKEFGVDEDKCRMHILATTTTYNQTLFDSYVNMLRSQTETMSAALAGVDSIVVTPFDACYEQPTDFSERIARNQQLILKEECHFDKIVDVSGGSYYIETLTKSIAAEAWKLFLATEEKGGFFAEARRGEVSKTINATNAERHANAGKRREFMLGTNQFPNFTEKSTAQPLDAPADSCGHSHESAGIEPLNTSRLASDFETLRLQTERASKQPVAFMLTIGNLVMRQARAQFSCNFLACAGYKVIDNLGFPTVEEGIEAAMKAKADIVVICSSDDEYADYAIPAFKALNGRAMFVVAGAPACTDELKAAGIENFIHVRVNQLETLREFNAKLGIK
ncbi:MAG: methylmalonyl-CoA mutase small subunit [Bacteroidaceae bacterium]|nr:methylmalonyl-CoA mutase small subunit [Bacteroidaceae bacterium]